MLDPAGHSFAKPVWTPDEKQCYLDLIKAIPEVRRHAVEQAARGWANGELLSPKAAQQTAQAIISAGWH